MQTRLAEKERESRRQVTLAIDNATSEAALARLQDNDETLLVFSSEGGGAMKVALGRYSKDGSTDFDWLLAGYSGDYCRIDRQSQIRPPVILESPRISLLWLVQPHVLRELITNAEARERGLTNRFLIFDSGARREYDTGENLAFTRGAKWVALINGILDRRQRGEFREIGCTPEAREVFRAFHNESIDLGNGKFADFKSELVRWRENAIRVAGVFAIATGADTITADTANNACGIVLWCAANYLSLLTKANGDKMRRQLDRLLDLVADYNGAAPLGTLASVHSIDRSHIESIIAAFPNRLRIHKEPQQGSKGGRPKETLRTVNPLNQVNPDDTPQGEGFNGNTWFADGGEGSKC